MLSKAMGLAVEPLVASWQRSLRQRNLAARTIDTYVESATQLAGWLSERGVTDVDDVTPRSPRRLHHAPDRAFAIPVMRW
jgi:site-specific recombinase XerD